MRASNSVAKSPAQAACQGDWVHELCGAEGVLDEAAAAESNHVNRSRLPPRKMALKSFSRLRRSASTRSAKRPNSALRKIARNVASVKSVLHEYCALLCDGFEFCTLEWWQWRWQQQQQHSALIGSCLFILVFDVAFIVCLTIILSLSLSLSLSHSLPLSLSPSLPLSLSLSPFLRAGLFPDHGVDVATEDSTWDDSAQLGSVRTRSVWCAGERAIARAERKRKSESVRHASRFVATFLTT